MKKNRVFKSIPFILAAVLLMASTACGNGAATTEAPAPGGVTNESPAQQATEVQQQSSAEPVMCEIPPPVELGLGEVLDGTIDGPAWKECFWVVLPEGLSRVSFSLGGLSDDLSLYVGYGFPIIMRYHTGEFWGSSEKGTADEQVVVDNPKPGPYFITVGIAGPKNPSTYSLSVLTEPEMTSPAKGQALPEADTCAFPAINVEIGAGVEGEIIGGESEPYPRNYYCVQVPDGLGSLTIKLSGLTGDLNLDVRHETTREWSDGSRGGSERMVVIPNPVAGSYYIDVISAYRNAGSAFTLSVSSP